MLLDQIKADALAARKAHDAVAASLGTTLLSEAAMVGKNAGNRDSTDAEVVAVVRKFVKNIDEALTALKDPERRAVLTRERELLAKYLPAATSEADVRAAVAELVAALPERTPKAMGTVMAGLKTRFGASLDSGLASKLAKEALAG